MLQVPSNVLNTMMPLVFSPLSFVKNVGRVLDGIPIGTLIGVNNERAIEFGFSLSSKMSVLFFPKLRCEVIY